MLLGQPTPDRSIAPYFVEDIRKMLEQKYGADALYQTGLRVQTTLDVDLQEAANAAIDRGLRRHGQAEERVQEAGAQHHCRRAHARDVHASSAGRSRSSPATSSRPWSRSCPGQRAAARAIRIGEHDLELKPSAFAWTRRTSAAQLFKVGDLIEVQVTIARREDAQRAGARAAAGGRRRAGGDRQPHRTDSRDGRRLQLRAQQVQPCHAGPSSGRARSSSRSSSPPRSIAASPRSRRSSTNPCRTRPGPNQPPYRPLNYDRKFEGPVTLRRALEQSRNIPAVKAMAETRTEGSRDLRQALRLEERLPAVPVAGAGRGRGDAGRDDQRLLRVSEPGRADGAVRGDVDRRSRRQHSPGESARAARGAARRHRVRHDQPAAWRRSAWNGDRRGTARLAARRQDRNDGRIHRCVVHRIRSQHHGRRVGGLRREEAARATARPEPPPRCRSGSTS